MQVTRYRRYRRRLLIRRIIICIMLAGILFILGLGTTAAVRGIGHLISKPPPRQGLGSSVGGNGSVPASASESAVSAVGSAPAVLDSGSPAKPEVPAGYFNDAVFIGDSRTEGLRNYDGLDSATYYAVKGLMVSTIYTKPAVELGGRKLTVMQALRQKKYGKVYIMLGVNELGWSSFETFIRDYGKVIDDIKKNQPGAAVYVQSILPVSAKKSAADKIYNNKKIDFYNTEIKKMALKKGACYLAVNTAVSDASGNLPEDASVDGIHFNSEYCKKWCGYLRAHTGSEREMGKK